ncbi:MAG: DNA-directed RNA polymerase subunit beta, partial [Planctomycetaceae bacterium]|nr:DNA-directed RNA polymerase subunit beta [Planctomycetaceae bacterium]
MPVPVQRVLKTHETRNTGQLQSDFEMTGLTRIQTDSYARFLQADLDPSRRKLMGLEEILREIFPIESFDQQFRLEYVKYELGKPRYSPVECRQLRLTYGRPLRVWLRLQKEEPVEEEVYLGDLPIMLGGGEFIVNGAERVVVSQLHRSPGVDFVMNYEPGERKTHSCRIIPERGSWIELLISKKETLGVRIDQSGKFSAMTLLRAMDKDHATDSELVKMFYPTQTVKLTRNTEAASLTGRIAAEDVIYPAGHEKCGEIIVECAHRILEVQALELLESGIKQVDLVDAAATDPLIINSILEDSTTSHEEALLRIYQRLRPGNPAQLDKAVELFREKFFDLNRYRLGRVGRFRINRKFHQDISDDEMTLRPEDFINSIHYLMRLRSGDDSAHVDDIDNLGNRRLRTIDELASDEIRKGFLKLRRTVQERMSLKDVETMTPRSLVNPKSISAAIEFFFGRSELSQVVDQTNPLSMLTHERRLSALGPGGLNRKRAGFEVRDVHISHYGRICPIETPEGTNIGLISSLSVYSKVDDYGFLITPYRKVVNQKVTDEIEWLRADEEAKVYVAPADTKLEKGKIVEERVLARYRHEFVWTQSKTIEYFDISPSQMVGVSAGLIPFLEHDDANRALMGSNMQRQAVPLLITEQPIVGTGMEKAVAENTGMAVYAEKSGKVTFVDANVVEVEGIPHPLRKYMGLNERTCLNQKPLVRVGDKVKKGQLLCDTAATRDGELALGRNVLVAFMSWEGYNFEDAIILSERLVKEDVYTSIHIDEFDVEIRETKLGREEFTRDIPNVSEKALRHLDDNGIVHVGTRVSPGDILVGKVTPKAKSELTPEEKLLHAIFGRAGEDVKNESLEVPSGVEGIVIHTERFSRRMSLTEVEKKTYENDLKKSEKEGNDAVAEAFKVFLKSFESALGKHLADDDGVEFRAMEDPKTLATHAEGFKAKFEQLDIRSPQKVADCRKIIADEWHLVEEAMDSRDARLNTLKRGDELPSGVLQMVKVYVASKRQISVGDKMAGRHGNKGVISKVLPIEDMPFLEDGTPVDIILNPLGVPSRMNVGQILETQLGWAAQKLGFRALCPVFDSIDENAIFSLMEEAGLPKDGKSQLYDGRTGEAFEQKTTVGQIYML